MKTKETAPAPKHAVQYPRTRLATTLRTLDFDCNTVWACCGRTRTSFEGQRYRNHVCLVKRASVAELGRCKQLHCSSSNFLFCSPELIPLQYIYIYAIAYCKLCIASCTKNTSRSGAISIRTTVYKCLQSCCFSQDSCDVGRPVPSGHPSPPRHPMSFLGSRHAFHG